MCSMIVVNETVELRGGSPSSAYFRQYNTMDNGTKQRRSPPCFTCFNRSAFLLCFIRRKLLYTWTLIALGHFYALLSAAVQADDDCAYAQYPEFAFVAQSDSSKVYLRVDSVNDESFKRAGLRKFCSVYGIKILAEDSVSSRKILHVATNMAELLDPKQNGRPASKQLLNLMNERHATLAIVENSDRIEHVFKTLPPMYQCVFYLVVEVESEITPHGPVEPYCPNGVRKISNVKYDKVVGLIADFVIQTGYPLTYPPNSDLGRLLRSAFLRSKAKGWLKVDQMVRDGDCNTECQEVSFQSWALTSALGVDSCTCREYDIWTLCTPDEMKRADPQLYGALTQDIKKPSGYYWSPSVVQ